MDESKCKGKLRCRVRPLEPWEKGYPYYKNTADFYWEECDENAVKPSDNQVSIHNTTSDTTHQSS